MLPVGAGTHIADFAKQNLLGAAPPTNADDDFWSLEVFEHCQCAKYSSVSMEYQLLCFACEIELRSGEISNTVFIREDKPPDCLGIQKIGWDGPISTRKSGPE